MEISAYILKIVEKNPFLKIEMRAKEDSSTLHDGKRNLARATLPGLTYESMKKQVKAIYDHCAATSETKVDDISDIKIETENVYFGQGYPGGRYNCY